MTKRELCLHAKGCDGCGRKLPKRRRRWCSDACAKTWYRNHLYRWARATAMRKARYKCKGCGARATEVDHIKPRNGMPINKPSCLHHQSNLRALCHTCHVNRKSIFNEA